MSGLYIGMVAIFSTVNESGQEPNRLPCTGDCFGTCLAFHSES